MKEFPEDLYEELKRVTAAQCSQTESHPHQHPKSEVEFCSPNFRITHAPPWRSAHVMISFREHSVLMNVDVLRGGEEVQIHSKAHGVLPPVNLEAHKILKSVSYKDVLEAIERIVDSYIVREVLES